MTVRVLYKVDSVEPHERHVGYEKNEDGSANHAKPISAKLYTARLSAVVPDFDAKGKHLEHPNYQVWATGIHGTLILANVHESVAATFQTGREYTVSIEPAQPQ